MEPKRLLTFEVLTFRFTTTSVVFVVISALVAGWKGLSDPVADGCRVAHLGDYSGVRRCGIVYRTEDRPL